MTTTTDPFDFEFDDCELCGEPLGRVDVAEMYDPDKPDEDSVLVHYDCGAGEGLILA